jgi:hypothetical protein
MSQVEAPGPGDTSADDTWPAPPPAPDSFDWSGFASADLDDTEERSPPAQKSARLPA